MARALTDDEYIAETDKWDKSAFRFEVKGSYSVAGERHSIARFHNGEPPAIDENSSEWLELIAAKASAGALMTRMRILDDPPTEYQHWLKWQDELNRTAGEIVYYLSRQAAIEAGLPARPEDCDWWILDDTRLLVLHHDTKGRRRRTELTTKRDEVQQARMWRDLAITAARKGTK